MTAYCPGCLHVIMEEEAAQKRQRERARRLEGDNERLRTAVERQSEAIDAQAAALDRARRYIAALERQRRG